MFAFKEKFSMRACIVIQVLFVMASPHIANSYQIQPSIPSEIDSFLKDGRESVEHFQYQKALDKLKKGLVLAKSNADKAKEGEFCREIAKAYYELGNYDKSQDYFRRALKVFKELDDSLEEAISWRGLGGNSIRLGSYAKAWEYYFSALEIHKKLEKNFWVTQDLEALGEVLWRQGKFSQAMEYYNQALVLAEKYEYTSLLGKILSGMGLIHSYKGEYSLALNYHQKALITYGESLGLGSSDLRNKAEVLTNLGFVYSDLGQHSEAEIHYRQALSIYEEINDRAGVAKDLANLGLAFWNRKEYSKAEEYYRMSIEIDEELGIPHGVAVGFANLGNIFADQGDFQKALDFYYKALDIDKRINDISGIGSDFTNIGLVLNDLGRYDQAITSFSNALVISLEVEDPSVIWQMFYGLQTSFVKLNNIDAAIYVGKLAIQTIQKLRAEIKIFEIPIQQAFLEEKRPVYEQLTNLLIERGRLWEAQQVLAMLKEEEYFDFTRRQSEETGLYTEVALTPQERDYVDRYQALQPHIVPLGIRHGQLLAIQKERTLIPAEQTELQQVEADLNQISLAFEVYLRDLEVAFQATPRDHIREFPEAELKNLEAFQSTLADLGPGTVALHFLSTKDRLRVIVTSGEEGQVPFHRDSLVGEKELNQQIQAYRDILQHPQRDPLPLAQALYKLLFGEIAEDLKKLKATTLLVYLDGALRYLPLAALHDGTHYVAEQYGVVLYTPAAKDNLKDRPVEQWRVAGLGVSEGSEKFSALLAVPEELDGIVKETREDDQQGVLPGVLHLDQAFTKEQFSRELRQGFPVVHLASHFRFGGGTDTDSYLLIGGGEKLTLTEFKGVQYPLKHVDLLTLSACETGVGGTGQDGREVEGLGALAQRRGAKAVLATLWSVADKSTGKFMQEFYQLRQEQHLTKAEALRQVQEGFIRGQSLTTPEGLTSIRAPGSEENYSEGTGTFVPPSGAPYAHPYYWAPFILMGNFL